jgi:hypothetical protein
MESQRECPLLHHELDSPSEFTPEELVRAVRAARDLPDVAVPAICILDFDGDLTDWLVLHRKAIPFEPWACFHICWKRTTPAVASFLERLEDLTRY